LCAVLDLFLTRRLPESGFVRQEQVNLSDFLANRFGKCYDCTAPDLSVKSGAKISA
jgi:saccharopine dehydrogenase-like NADP-dependent oxidoreductase